MIRNYLIIIFILSAYLSSGQNDDRQGMMTVSTIIDSDCILIKDSLSIAPLTVSVQIDGNIIDTGYLVQNNLLYLSDSICSLSKGMTAIIQYRTLPLNIEETFYHLDSSAMKTVDRAIYIGSDYNFKPKGQEIIDAKGLDYNGSFSRGFSVGNSQSLVLNSNFNLQLAGDLGNDLKVVAAISDDNIPIQPEGNTQLIQEFDKVFIKISKDETNVIAGDYNLGRPQSYFINYNKKLKGLSANTIMDFGSNRSFETKGSFAISRGKFARQILETKEGNQGPYKLTGNNGERFLIVLSGSEKIYLDGQLLERGLDYDYIIDYNRAEVTFTPNRLIGRESRIIVEYEYRDQNYLRSVYAADLYYSAPKYELSFNFYNEQDSKNATGDIVLDSMDIQQLRLAGDDINGTRINSIRPVTDSTQINGQVKYRINTNVFDGDTIPFFLEFSTDVFEDLVVASFSEVDQGTGRYIIDEESLVNGRVYKYVGPNNGNYEPFTTLTPPEKKQIMSFGSKWKPTQNILLTSEFSLSNNDVNRFADIGNQDNVGTAGVINYNHKLPLDKKKKIGLTIDSKYEFLHENYLALNPYRKAEFARDWNIQNPKINGRQNLLETGATFSISDSLIASYTFNSFDIQDKYQGNNQTVSLKYRSRGFSLDGNYRYLQSEGFGENTLFKRPKVTISQILSQKKAIKISAFYDGETNLRKNTDAGNDLTINSFSFDNYKAFIENSESNTIHYKFIYSNRKDFFPQGESLVESINTNEITANTKFQLSKNHNLSFNFGLRNFDVKQSELTPLKSKSKKTLIGRLDHNLNAWNGLFLSNTNYIINSGQEPKVEYFFEKVEKGQGDYIYVGNADSTLINANFRYAPNLGTGEYIRLSLINNEFISTNNQSLTQSLRIDPKKFFLNRKRKKREKEKEEEKARKEKLKNKETIETKPEKKLDALAIKMLEKKKKRNERLTKFLSRFSTVSTFRISKKVEDDGQSQQATFLNFSSRDTNLVTYSSLINNTLLINKGNPTFDAQIGNKRTSNIFTQISGLEERRLDENFLRSRVKIGQTTDFILNLKQGVKSYESEIFTTRNLDIDYYQISPQISYRPSQDLRFNALYSYDDRQQKIGQKEMADSHDFTFSATYRRATQTNINLSISLVNVTYNGEPNSPIEFDMLEGLKNGRNYIWNTLFTRRLSGNVDLNLSYEGRKSENAETIHIARAQVKATF